MRYFKDCIIPKKGKLISKLIKWSSNYDVFCLLNSNSYMEDKYSSYDFVLACGNIDEIDIKKGDSFNKLKEFQAQKNDYIFGFMSYDLKNETENLHSNNPDKCEMPLMHFFQPDYLFLFKDDVLSIGIYGNKDFHPNEILKSIEDTSFEFTKSKINNIRSNISKEKYISIINKINEEIQKGIIYEMNFCQEFYSEDSTINPYELYISLNEMSPTPFSCFYRVRDKYLICASPERFLKKSGDKIISQPIKGTIRRDGNESADKELKKKLFNDIKERCENVMIVDLVRNDLSKTSIKASVVVEELFGIYSFSQVHQMISTISSRKRKDVHIIDVIKNAFPMGSMTGAPKIIAMKLIEEFEDMKRGLYSGSVGYITPDNDFDFNVVIRSIIYNDSNNYLSYCVGGAITSNSVPEDEYNECLLKSEAIRKVLDRIENY